MDVLRLTRAFRTALFLFVFVTLFAVAFEAVLSTHSEWWSLPYPVLGIWCGVAAVISIPLAIGQGGGRHWANRTAVVLGGIWTLCSALLAIRVKSPGLGFFTIFLGLFLFSILAWIRKEMGRSFFDPYLEWYQGFPKPVPGLLCLIVGSERRGHFRVSRIDEEGVFLFQETTVTAEERRNLFQTGEKELVFVFRDREFRCHGLPIRIFRKNLGGGFQFKGLAPDVEKNLGDFVESLRGEGYVF